MIHQKEIKIVKCCQIKTIELFGPDGKNFIKIHIITQIIYFIFSNSEKNM